VEAQGVDYGRLTALLIEASKEQQALIRQQQEQLRAQLALSKIQQTRIARLSSQVKAIQASLNANSRTSSQVRTVKAQVPMVQQ
jgi:predicted phage tail protein